MKHFIFLIVDLCKRTIGKDMSCFVNNARIKEAQAAYLEGKLVSQARLSSEFNSKSNLNHECLRAVGVRPGNWHNPKLEITSIQSGVSYFILLAAVSTRITVIAAVEKLDNQLIHRSDCRCFAALCIVQGQIAQEWEGR